MPVCCTIAPRSTPAGVQQHFSSTPAAAGRVKEGSFAATLAPCSVGKRLNIVAKWSSYLGSITARNSEHNELFPGPPWMCDLAVAAATWQQHQQRGEELL
eukprot:scaffold190638_cov17-Tisochrysis_lutea.AAC.1